MAFQLSDSWNNFWNGILGDWHSPYIGPDLGASSTAQHDPDGYTHPTVVQPIESPSTGLEVSSDFGYSNENNAKYQNFNYYDEYLDMIQKGAEIGLFSTAQNAVDEAQKDRAFQALEAEKTRDWYEKMSDTSFQRQVADLEAAGLNPILGWAHSGVGAPTAMSSTPQGRSTNIQSQAPSLSDYVNAGANVINSAGKLLTSVSKLMIPL